MASPTPTADASRPLLLVVDDELPVLKVLERLAARIGFDVVTCASGADAMCTLMRKPADLAMVDLRMPDVNGLDLLRQIRAAVPRAPSKRSSWAHVSTSPSRLISTG